MFLLSSDLLQHLFKLSSIVCPFLFAVWVFASARSYILFAWSSMVRYRYVTTNTAAVARKPKPMLFFDTCCLCHKHHKSTSGLCGEVVCNIARPPNLRKLNQLIWLWPRKVWTWTAPWHPEQHQSGCEVVRRCCPFWDKNHYLAMAQKKCT